MNQFDALQHIVDHAQAWGIDDDGITRVSFSKLAPTIRLRDHDVTLFHRWAQHLTMPLISIATTGTALIVDGQLMCGHRVHVTVRVDPTTIQRAGAHGMLTLGHVTQIAQAGTRAVA